MNVRTHKIDKQVLNVEMQAGENSHDVQKHLGYICTHTLPKILEKICDDICTDDYWITLDKISIDIGNLPISSFEEEMKEKVAEKLEEVLKESFSGNIELMNEDSRKNIPFSSAIEILKYYLSSGALPVWVDSYSIRLEQFFDKVLAEHPKEFVYFAINSLHKQLVCSRLALVLKEKQFDKLILVLTNNISIHHLLDDLVNIVKSSSRLDPIDKINIKESILFSLLESSPNISSREILDKIIKRSNSKSSLIKLTIDLEATISEFIKKGHIFRSDLPQYVNKVALKTWPGNTIEYTNHGSISSPSLDNCRINNAGLILLWPGITHVFAECGITKEDVFVSETTAERAVLLLHYAVSGKQKIPEYELPLNKLFCGLEITTPVATTFRPDKTEKKAVQKLLHTIINEWTVLKGSTPEELQTTYLQREGILTKKGNDWHLEAEHQTQDILLDQIPWGFGTVKLPWMNHIIHTEW